MGNKPKIPRISAIYQVFAALFLLRAVVYNIIAEPTTLNLVAGFIAIVLFGLGLIIAFNKLFTSARFASSVGHPKSLAGIAKASTQVLLNIFVKSAAIMLAVIAFVSFRNDGMILDLTSWLMILLAFVTLTTLSWYVKTKKMQP